MGPRAIDIGPRHEDGREPGHGRGLAGDGERAHDARPSLAELFSRATAEGKDYARAEVEVVKAKAARTVAHLKWAVIFFAAAAVIALSTVTALLVGSILTLETLMGPGLATLAVVLGALAVAGLLGWLGARELSRRSGAAA